MLFMDKPEKSTELVHQVARVEKVLSLRVFAMREGQLNLIEQRDKRVDLRLCEFGICSIIHDVDDFGSAIQILAPLWMCLQKILALGSF